MELRDYLKIISKAKYLILGITVVVLIATGVWSETQPLTYDSGVTMVVNKPNPVSQRSSSYYQYDKYYSIQASSLFADTLTAWLSSPGTAKEIFQRAGYDAPDQSLRKLGKIFKPRRLPPSTINITVTDRDQAKAEKLVTASVDIIKERNDQQKTGDDADHFFTIIADQPVTAANKQDLAVNLAIGLVAGLILGFMVAFGQAYLKQN